MYNKTMQKAPRRFRLGFTLVEVTLVLAISTALAMAILGTITTNIHRQRYVDAYTDLSSFLRSAYSATINVQNTRLNTEDTGFFCTINSIWDENGRLTSQEYSDNFPGRTRCAIYGKLLTFGETDPKTGAPDTRIHMYDIIGRVYTGQMNVENARGDNALNSLKAVSANVVTIRTESSACRVNFAGQETVYTPQWQTRIERPVDHQLFRGAIMIVRSPVSGTVHTYYYDQPGQTFDVNQFITNLNQSSPTQPCESTSLEHFRPHSANALVYGALGEIVYSQSGTLNYFLRDSKMQKDKDFTICLASEDLPLTPKRRRPIRIKADGNNASAIELVDIDGADNSCN